VSLAKNLSQEFMKMKAKKEQNEQIMTEFFLDLIMISKKTFLLLYAKPWDYVLLTHHPLPCLEMVHYFHIQSQWHQFWYVLENQPIFDRCHIYKSSKVSKTTTLQTLTKQQQQC
jgi:hypothetical protein